MNVTSCDHHSIKNSWNLTNCSYTLICPFPNRYEEAVAAYEEAQLLEPDNKGTKASLTQAKGKIADLEKKSALASSSGLT